MASSRLITTREGSGFTQGTQAVFSSLPFGMTTPSSIDIYELSPDEKNVVLRTRELVRGCFEREFIVYKINKKYFKVPIVFLKSALKLSNEEYEELRKSKGRLFTFEKVHELHKRFMSKNLQLASVLPSELCKAFVDRLTPGGQSLPIVTQVGIIRRSERLRGCYHFLVPQETYDKQKKAYERYFGNELFKCPGITSEESTKLKKLFVDLTFLEKQLPGYREIRLIDGDKYRSKFYIPPSESGIRGVHVYVFSNKINGCLDFFITRTPLDFDADEKESLEGIRHPGFFVGAMGEEGALTLKRDDTFSAVHPRLKERLNEMLYSEDEATQEFGGSFRDPNILGRFKVEPAASSGALAASSSARSDKMVTIVRGFSSESSLSNLHKIDYGFGPRPAIEKDAIFSLFKHFQSAKNCGYFLGELSPAEIGVSTRKGNGSYKLKLTFPMTSGTIARSAEEEHLVDPKVSSTSPDLAAKYLEEGKCSVSARTEQDEIWTLGVHIHHILAKGAQVPFIQRAIDRSKNMEEFFAEMKTFFQEPRYFDDLVAVDKLSISRTYEERAEQAIMLMTMLLCFQKPSQRKEFSVIYAFYRRGLRLVKSDSDDTVEFRRRIYQFNPESGPINFPSFFMQVAPILSIFGDTLNSDEGVGNARPPERSLSPILEEAAQCSQRSVAETDGGSLESIRDSVHSGRARSTAGDSVSSSALKSASDGDSVHGVLASNGDEGARAVLLEGASSSGDDSSIIVINGPRYTPPRQVSANNGSASSVDEGSSLRAAASAGSSVEEEPTEVLYRAAQMARRRAQAFEEAGVDGDARAALLARESSAGDDSSVVVGEEQSGALPGQVSDSSLQVDPHRIPKK